MGLPSRACGDARHTDVTTGREAYMADRSWPIDQHIWFVSAEAVPFAKVGGLGDVAGELPVALARQGLPITQCLPLHGGMKIPAEAKTDVLVGLPAWVGPASVHKFRHEGCSVQFYSLPRWFGRDRVYGWADDSERYAAFCLAVAVHAAHSAQPPAVLHVHDWHASAIAMLVHLARKLDASHPLSGLSPVRTLLTLHSLQYQGGHHPNFCYLFDMGFDMESIAERFREGYQALRAGILYADAINTVSPTHATEICQPGGGFGLEETLRQRVATLRPGLYRGILNRLGPSWDPKLDTALAVNFSESEPSARDQNRTALHRQLGWLADAAPLAAFVGRLAAGKGVELLEEAAPAWLAQGMKLVVLGMGEPHQEDMVRRLAHQWPTQVVWKNAYLPNLARLIYGGADMLLMPSEREACGISQQIAMRYGCIPIARRTGGLADTIVEGFNGFLYVRQDRLALHRAMTRALAAFAQKDRWEDLVRQAMRTDAGWEGSATAYAKMYAELMKG